MIRPMNIQGVTEFSSNLFEFTAIQIFSVMNERRVYNEIVFYSPWQLSFDNFNSM